jgi:hypothetical protein
MSLCCTVRLTPHGVLPRTDRGAGLEAIVDVTVDRPQGGTRAAMHPDQAFPDGGVRRRQGTPHPEAERSFPSCG